MLREADLPTSLLQGSLPPAPVIFSTNLSRDQERNEYLQFPRRERRRIGQQVPVVYRNQQDSGLRSLGVGAGGDQETLPLSLTSHFSSYVHLHPRQFSFPELFNSAKLTDCDWVWLRWSPHLTYLRLGVKPPAPQKETLTRGTQIHAFSSS